MNEFFIQFYNPLEDTLSPYYLDQTMISSLAVSVDFFSGKGKTLTMSVKNPRNIFNSDYSGDSSNIFNEIIPFSDWRDYFVPDGQFFIAKGTKEDWDNLSDDDKTKRLIGIFRINKAEQQMGSQSLTVNAQDLMKYPMRAVAYNGKDVIQYPPNNWDDDLMSVGQIVHDVFHRLGVWHYHKDGHIDNNPNGAIKPDGQIFYSTNMYFSPASPKSDEQILDMKFVYDFIKTFANYTGYLFYVKGVAINGVPRPVFYFAPPSYEDDTQILFGANEINLDNPPTSTHEDSIKVVNITYGEDDKDIRGYVAVSTADSTAIIENTGQSGARMRDKDTRIGIIKQPDIHDIEINGAKISSAKAIGVAVMSQIMSFYRSLNVTFSNWIKFSQKVYNFALNSTDLNIHINDYYYCKGFNINWNKGLMTTNATFSWYKPDEFPHVAPSIFCVNGDQKIGVYFPQVGADKYEVYLNNTLNTTITPTDGAPIDYTITGLTNGTTYQVYVKAYWGTTAELSNTCTATPNPNNDVGGGGSVARYD